MNSMTGFGKSEIAVDGRKLRIEIKTVNHRFLDINIRSPRFLSFLEDEVRKAVKARLARGRVELFVGYSSEREDAKKVVVDMPLILAYIEAANEITSTTGMENDVTASLVMRLPDAVSYEEAANDEDALRSLMQQTLSAALDELQAARAREGAELQKDIEKRLALLEGYAAGIKERAGTVVQEYKQKLEDRLAELLSGSGAQIDPQRLAQEVALYADRCNITEELVRIRSHLSHFLDSSGPAQGRNMDFIVQELNREFNTIGSKAQNTDILNNVIAAKGEIEKIREQIQNIE